MYDLMRSHSYVRVKICGVTRVEDAVVAEEAGADAVGVVMYSDSPRSICPDEAEKIFAALGPFTARVVVTHTTSPDDLDRVIALHPAAVQVSHLHDVPRAAGVQVIRVVEGVPLPPHADAYIVDRSCGTGRPFDPAAVRAVMRESRVPVVLAGGLDPRNVRAAVEAFHPYAVDVCSGVERVPGVKDPALIRAFVAAARGCPSGENGRPA
ncbi:phosphoribosylanthranilate isomerase [uncultured Methanofollis sp.]|uniref:phosphoribosylanthranilate isomerase n=1 Tax=uncultured Methanofollis sp. TaxID=262500 RepID=UPI00262C6C39|nr:phosphoribosylanthranilate isomerase [uncultured Methanofollis sp.]